MLKLPDEIYLLHDAGDDGETIWCDHVPNDTFQATKYIRADLLVEREVGLAFPYSSHSATPIQRWKRRKIIEGGELNVNTTR